ncbi:MAG: hypothetical protein C0602_02945 [Denitrovibrio sp.]|nr:MAG: hypothetical protein C0602_02945 [Denitrovibrio sp.]
MHNELHREKSLYLKQHQDNPVAWQPYNDDTLKMARRENKPMFLSIGYSSCHWCHVMAHESFEDPEIAKIINKYFIPVKVDREEFPAVDKRYQFYLHATGKKGGWPLSVFVLPDGRPFFGGTYFPKEDRFNLPSFAKILVQLGSLFIDSPEEAVKYAMNFEKFNSKFIGSEHKYEDLVDLYTSDILLIFQNMFDKQYGGLGKDAKFPNIPVLNSLLTYFEDEEIRESLILTADKLCTTGIYDHIYGGFYRYTVDREWTVPHFEKMLYDNAQNASFLLDMFGKTDNTLYLKIAEKTIDFMLTEFSTEFGMITAMDADSLNTEGKLVEGYYYLVSEAHIEPVKEFIELHEGVINLNTNDYNDYIKIEGHLDKLKEVNERTKPLKDEKVILSQNMLFCSSLLRMFEMSGKEYYMEQATSLLGKLRHFHIVEDKLFRLNYQGDVTVAGTLEDYVYTIKTLLDFFEVTKERTFLSEAASFTESALDQFYDKGIFYLDNHKNVVDTFDDSTPNPATLLVFILEQYSDVMGIAKDRTMLDFAADRFIKYAGGHPTLFKALKGYLGR